MNKHARLYFIALLGGALLMALLLTARTSAPATNEQTVAPIQTAERKALNVSKPLIANAAYVWDLKENSVLYEKNAEIQLPLASLTKLMTSLVANELLPETQAIALTESILRIEGESGFTPGEFHPSQTLIEYALIESSNDAAQALAGAAGAFLGEQFPLARFIDRMNEKALALNLNQTYFLNPTGLDESAHVAGAYGSARDIAQLIVSFARAYPDIAYKSGYPIAFLTPSRSATNTNPITASFPGIIASKTGFTDLAGGNLAMVVNFGLNHPIVLVVLGSGHEERFSDMEVLLSAVQTHFENL